MNADRVARLWSLVVQHAADASVTVDHVCAAALVVGGVDSAAIAVTLSATPRETVSATGPQASELEELTLTLGEGPGADAGDGTPVLVPDLTAAACLRRWPAFAPAAAESGVRAMFAIPLQIGAARLGAMNLYRAAPGALDRHRLADVLSLADMASSVLLDTADQARERARGSWSEKAIAQHAEVHQATGMISVQLEVTVAVALIRLRAYAYAHDRRLRDVARDVVERRLRFERDRG